MRLHEFHTRQPREHTRNPVRIHRARVQSRAHSGATQIEIFQFVLRGVETCHIPPHGPCISRKFLPETDGNSILQMCAPHLHHMVKLPGFFLQRVLQRLQTYACRTEESARRHSPRRGKYIVGGLAQIYMVVGTHECIITLFPAQKLDCAIGNDFIRIHIQRRPRSALYWVNNELVVQPPTQYFITGSRDGLRPLFIQLPRCKIRQRRCLFNLHHAFYERRVRPLPRNAKVFHSTQRLYSIIRLLRNRALTN